MDTDASFRKVVMTKGLLWLGDVDDKAHLMAAWATEHHPERLPCQLEEKALHGSYNLCRIVVFDNGEKWIIRLPLLGRTSQAHRDEKVAGEVATLKLLRERTNIPVPEVKAWGLADENPLDLGPFIMQEFIQGEDLGDILEDPADEHSSLMSVRVDDETVKVIYRQVAQFMLQIFKLDFEEIGGLPIGSPDRRRPLTLAAHEIIRLGGVNVLGSRSEKLLTTKEFFDYIVDQQWQQLHEQLNSADDEEDAREKYIFVRVLKSLTSRYTWPDYNEGPFKLICDDFGPRNMRVKDCKITGVIDQEFSYAGPAQLLATAPWWLLLERPHMWDFSSEMEDRFFRHLDMFQRVLEEEEDAMPGHEGKELSMLIKRSREDGTMWFIMVLQGFFQSPDNFPCTQLIRHTPGWDELVKGVPEEEIQAFVAKKMKHMKLHGKREEETLATYNDKLLKGLIGPDVFFQMVEGPYERGDR
ncbi:phosphotransferase enzyme family protein [Xylaria digitata]|nr:phosphotransferase enzyme family protein [Xylaria digitata]